MVEDRGELQDVPASTRVSCIKNPSPLGGTPQIGLMWFVGRRQMAEVRSVARIHDVDVIRQPGRPVRERGASANHNESDAIPNQ